MFGKKYWITPSGSYPALYRDLIDNTATHLMIAGAAGSGKSVVINGLIYSLLYQSPETAQFIFIDPKRVELCAYKDLPHCIAYAKYIPDIIKSLGNAVALMERRYDAMSAQGLKRFIGPRVYIVIDEYADLITTCKKQVEPLIQRLSQLGRAASVMLIMATQCPLSCVINTTIKVNVESRLGLHTACEQDSRNIIGKTGLELLPRYGKGILRCTDGYKPLEIPMVEPERINAIVSHWKKHKKPERLPKR